MMTFFTQNTPIGSVVYSLVVSDDDLGENADVRFRISTPVSIWLASSPGSSQFFNACEPFFS